MKLREYYVKVPLRGEDNFYAGRVMATSKPAAIDLVKRQAVNKGFLAPQVDVRFTATATATTPKVGDAIKVGAR